MISLVLTTCSAETLTSTILPDTGASIGFSIFIDSSIQSVSPSLTVSPTLTLTLIILPVMGTSFDGAMWDRARHQAVLEDAELVISRLAKLGGRTLGTSVGHAPQRKTEAQLDAQAELLRKIIVFGAKNGVVLNLHNHTYEVADNLHDLKGTLARIPDVKLGPDLNWLVRGGVDPAQFIRQYGKQIVFLHLRDQNADGRWSEALGEGSMDYPGIAQALREIGFHGDAVIELAHEGGFKPTRPLRESLKMSREFVRRTLGY